MTRTHRPLPRVLAGVLALLLTALLLPTTAYARPSGRTVLLEDYYLLSDGNAAQVPGLRYICSGHGTKMEEYYVEVEDDGRYTVPGIIEKVGNKLRYVQAYYCPTCYETWKGGSQWTGDGIVFDDGGSKGKTLEDYFDFLSESSLAALSSYGYYYTPQDDSDHAPQGNYTTATSTVTEQPDLFQVDENGCLIGTSGKALTTVSLNPPSEADPLAHWEMPGAFAFYQFFYTGMQTVINKPASADDPAWDTVRDMTRIYYMQRQQQGQLAGPRVNYSLHWYGYDYSMLGDWVVTDLMAEYATGELCSYVSYTGQGTEVAVPETVTIPLYGQVKVVGVDIEDHNLKKVYINDNVTCIRRLSSVNLEEITGCKNLEYIEKYAFQNDVSLTSIPEMPKLDWIAMGAFEGCISLRDIKLPDNMTFIDFTAFGWYDTVLGNYDIGMTDQSWEDFQYLSDLSDNDKILGLTLYAKKGSTTWNLLDTLINKNDALTPDLDENGKSYFRSYGDRIAMMSGEVKNYTAHWNLKSSGDYKGTLATSGKDVDDTTGGRLGEYDSDVGITDIFKDPTAWLQRFLSGGGLTFSALLLLLMSLGISQVDFSGLFKEERKKWWSWDWTGKTTYADNVERNKYIFEALDKIADSIEGLGKTGELGSEFIKTAGGLQDLMDAYAETGSFLEAWYKTKIEAPGVDKIAGALSEANPATAAWDISGGLILGDSPMGDALSVGNNVQHGVDFLKDMVRSVWGEAQKNPTAPAGTKYPGLFDVDAFTQNIADGAYGENLKNLGLTGDLLFTKGSISQTFSGIYGEDGIGGWNFAYEAFKTLGEKSAENNPLLETLRDSFSQRVEDFYAGR